MAQNHPRVPYGLTVHGEEEIEAVLQVLRTSTQMGKCVNEMEQKVAALYDKKHGIMVNSGSSALYLAVEAAGLQAGSEVITPCLTFATTVACIVKNNLVPVFIDVEPGTYCIDARKVEAAITPKTRAMLVPNLIGNLPDWPQLASIAKKHDLLVIEDSADTLGATWDGKSAGVFSDISITSFYGSHVINCAGNGGMLCVNSDEQRDRAKLLRSWGRSSSLFVESEAIENRFNVELDGIQYDAKFVFETIGYNLEPSEMGAAFGLVQLKKLQHNIDARMKWFEQLRKFFETYEEWFILPEQRLKTRTGWLAFPVTLKKTAPFSRRDLQIFLEKRNIQTRVVFTGNILRQPGFRNINCVKDPAGYKHADDVMRGGMLIACHHGLNDTMVAHMQESLKAFLTPYGAS
ncbi:MAG: DegT/DnrJ/EryC1/StrS family aminotransferase [Alphaproteobacteria bacterium]